MGFTDFFTDVWETFANPSPDAEAPPQGGSSTQSPASGTNEESDAEAEVNKQDQKKGGSNEQGFKPTGKGSDAGGDDEEPEEEDEDEEEPDPKDVFEKRECTLEDREPVSTNSEIACALRDDA
jgi:ubiquinol-cytochrome c reductase subunit 6